MVDSNGRELRGLVEVPARIPEGVTCDQLLSAVVEGERSGDVDGMLDTELEWLGNSCPDEYSVFIAYSSGKGYIDVLGDDGCAALEDETDPRAMALLVADGVCTGGGVAVQPSGSISWDAAIDRVGAVERVCGPLKGIGYSDDDVFLNVGRDYPDPRRFTIVIWDVGRLEPIESGRTVCTEGLITNYEGVAQIQQRDPGSILIAP